MNNENLNKAINDAIRGITDITQSSSLVALDYGDVLCALPKDATIHVGYGSAKGRNYISKAVRKALKHSSLKGLTIRMAKGILLSIKTDGHLFIEELGKAARIVYRKAGKGADVFWGSTVDDSLGDEARVVIYISV